MEGTALGWRTLLMKYIKHVSSEEGIDFIADGRIDLADEDIGFSKDEKDILRSLSHEVLRPLTTE